MITIQKNKIQGIANEHTISIDANNINSKFINEMTTISMLIQMWLDEKHTLFINKKENNIIKITILFATDDEIKNLQILINKY